MGVRAPMVGEWYTELNTSQLFEIVAFDESGASVEILYQSGEHGSYSLDSWHTLNLEMAAPPEDWSGDFDGGVEESQLDDYGLNTDDCFAHADADTDVLSGFEDIY